MEILAHRRRLPFAPTLVAGALLLIAAAVVSAGTGAVAIPPGRILAQLLAWLGGAAQELSSRDHLVLVGLRLPRIAAAILVGASLAAAGAALQGVFRNPLADPALIGVSSGAATAAAALIVLGGNAVWVARALPLAAFVGGIVATLLVFLLARRAGQVSVTAMLLAGIAVNALAGAAIGLFSYLGDDVQLRQLTFWTLGSLAAVRWDQLPVAGTAMVAALAGLGLHARALDVFVLGERDAFALGLNPAGFAIRVVVLAALAVGAAVSLAGPIGFVGLVAPHVVRLAAGPAHRRLLPLAMIAGALVTVVADTLARVVAQPAELPIGLLLALVGAPVFLWLLRHGHAGGAR